MSELSKCFCIAWWFGWIPRTHLSAKLLLASANSSTDCKLLYTINGFATFNSKCDNIEFPAEMAQSLPITCAHTIINASHCVGLTFPGIIELPGSFSGKYNSPNPALGPDPNNRTSLAIFERLNATVFNIPLNATCASCAANASNLFGAETNGNPVNLEISFAISSA